MRSNHAVSASGGFDSVGGCLRSHVVGHDSRFRFSARKGSAGMKGFQRQAPRPLAGVRLAPDNAARRLSLQNKNRALPGFCTIACGDTQKRRQLVTHRLRQKSSMLWILTILCIIIMLAVNDWHRKKTGVNKPSQNAMRRIHRNARQKGITLSEAHDQWLRNKQRRRRV
jgi:hypothetical protein